jgi:hypothetical protein
VTVQNNPDRQTYLDLISEKQQRATALSIQVKLDAQDSDDMRVLAETADKLDGAVRELERARRVLVEA